MPSGSITTDHLGHVHRKRVNGRLPFRSPLANAVAVKLEDIQKARRNACPQRWHPHRCLRNLEECVRSGGKSPSIRNQFGNTELTSLQDPVHGGQLAAAWGTRETFIAVVTTNLPMVFPLLKIWLKPWLPTTLNSNSKSRAYKAHGSGFVTIGGGGASASNRSRPQQSRDASRNMTFDNESEECIVGDVKMQRLPSVGGGTERILNKNDIMVSTHVSVTRADADSQNSAKSL